MRWTSYIGVLFLLAGVVCVSGCGSDESGDAAIPSFFVQQEASSEKTDVDVYWDATYSMQGYTTIPEGNVYRNLPDGLEDVGNSMGNTKFFRFGEQVQPLEGREHRRFSEVGFYDETITAIHTVVDTADTNHLSIIVTDLFESDADWSNVAKKIKDKYFASHLAVAVIGIKNPFNGDIFDVGVDNAKFNYNSGNNPERYRPFYMLIMGHEGQVREFLQRWKDKNPGGNEMQYMLLSGNLMEKAPDLSNMEIQDSKNIFADEKLNVTDKRVKEFGINDGDESVELKTAFHYQPLPNGCSVDISKSKPVVHVYSLQDGEWKDSGKDGDAVFNIQENGSQTGDYQLSLKFTPDKTLNKDQINLVYAAVEPGYNGLVLPAWVKQWNMDNPAGVTPENFDGSKTINFMHLVESLKDSVLDAAKPALANMTLLIKY